MSENAIQNFENSFEILKRPKSQFYLSKCSTTLNETYIK